MISNIIDKIVNNIDYVGEKLPLCVWFLLLNVVSHLPTFAPFSPLSASPLPLITNVFVLSQMPCPYSIISSYIERAVP